MTTAPTDGPLSRPATEQRQLAEAPKLAPAPQYATGFEGAASAPFSAEAVAVLSAPVNELEVEVRPDGIVYMPGVWYRRQLSRAFGAGAWALLPRGPARRDGDMCMYHGGLYVLGRFVSEALGECEARFGMSYASALEGARTDCLTRTCKDLGMATELWDPAWRDGWLKKYTEREWTEPKGNGKAKWVYKLRAKAGGEQLLAGRNSAAPTPAAAASAAAASETGEAPSEGDLADLRKAVAELEWPKVRARNWLKKHFGQDQPGALTKRQCQDAVTLLVSSDPALYAEILAGFVNEGRATA
jgi:hypothetical protein